MWKPEHMCRIGPGASPSRASRAAVSASAGAPSVPHASSDWDRPARRSTAWIVRTCASSPWCEADMTAISGSVRWNCSAPPASSSAADGKRLDRRTQRGDVVRIAHAALDLAGDVDLDDVAAMAALDERSAAHFGEHGRSRATRVAGARQRRSVWLLYRSRSRSSTTPVAALVGVLAIPLDGSGLWRSATERRVPRRH